MAGFDFARRKAGSLQRLVHRAREGVRQINPFARPIRGKITLPSAENVDHGQLHATGTAEYVPVGRLVAARPATTICNF